MFQTQSNLRQYLTPVALAFVSLFAALALWVAVTDAENPRETREFRAPLSIVAINVADGLAVGDITQNAVTISVSATDDEFERLTAANFRVQVDMTGVREARSSRSVTVDVVGIDDVEIVSIAPRFVDVLLEQEATKTIPVRVNRIGIQPQGFVVASEQANPQEVRVTGATSLIQLVESADVDINLTGVRVNIQQEFPLTPRDGSRADLPRLRLEPDTAEIRMTIVQQETTLLLPVQVQTSGTLPDGYNIDAISADPQLVQVSATLGVLQGITSCQGAACVLTEPIDLSGQRNDITRSIALRVPPGVTASRNNVTVTIGIRATPGERVLSVAPQVVDLPAGMQYTLQTQSLNVKLTGELPVLNNIGAGQIRATVSAANLSEGVHVLPVQITVPSGATLASYEPQQVVLVLRR
jgi:YbbR domain-containing protein